MSTTIQLIQETTTLHVYTTQCLFKTVRHDTVQQPLVQVCCWCVGEYGDQLVAGNCSEDEPLEVSIWVAETKLGVVISTALIVVTLCNWTRNGKY